MNKQDTIFRVKHNPANIQEPKTKPLSKPYFPGGLNQSILPYS